MPRWNKKWWDGSGDVLTNGGDAVDIRPNYDSMLIDPVGGTNGYVYGGPWNATTSNARYKLKVGGADSAGIGGTVCTSGANSGEHCNLTVTDHALIVCPDATDGTGLAWIAKAAAGKAATVAGDSGGPVYHDWRDGTVGARGVINSGASTVTCPSTASDPYGKCYNQVFFIGTMDLLDKWNVKIEVG